MIMENVKTKRLCAKQSLPRWRKWYQVIALIVELGPGQNMSRKVSEKDVQKGRGNHIFSPPRIKVGEQRTSLGQLLFRSHFFLLNLHFPEY